MSQVRESETVHVTYRIRGDIRSKTVACRNVVEAVGILAQEEHPIVLGCTHQQVITVTRDLDMGLFGFDCF